MAACGSIGVNISCSPFDLFRAKGAVCTIGCGLVPLPDAEMRRLTPGTAEHAMVLTTLSHGTPTARSRVKSFQIYVAAGQTDCIEEASVLVDKVLPSVLKWSATSNIVWDLEFVELRCGRDFDVDENFCLEELKEYVSKSGPTFIGIVGQKTGPTRLNLKISKEEYESLYNVFETDEERTLLSSYYKLDENAIPPCYTLVDITLNEQVASERIQLKKLLEKNARKCLPFEQTRRFMLPPLLLQISQGTISKKTREIETVPFFLLRRMIDDMSMHVGAPHSQHFVDLVDNGTQNAAAAAVLTDFCENEMNLDNVMTTRIHWAASGGMDPQIPEHRKHLDSFACAVESWIKDKIAVDLKKEMYDRPDTVFDEVAVHWSQAYGIMQYYIDRTDVDQALNSFIQNESSSHVGMLLTGDVGSGKSWSMVKAATTCSDLFPSKVIAYRRCGLSGSSCNVRGLILSLCDQICRAYSSQLFVHVGACSSIMDIMVEFVGVLKLATPEKPLVLFIDALDALDSEDGNELMLWLPQRPLSNVKLIISMRSAAHSNSWGKHYETYNMPLPSQEFSSQLLTNELQKRNRTLTPSQMDFVHQQIESNNIPLHTAIIAGLASNVKSWEDVSSMPALSSLASSRDNGLQSLVSSIIKEAEGNFGSALVSAVVGYIAASRYGLCTSELSYLLSHNQSVGSEIACGGETTSPRFHIQNGLWLPLLKYLQNVGILMKGCSGCSARMLYTFQHDVFRSMVLGSIPQQQQQENMAMLMDMYDVALSIGLESMNRITTLARVAEELPTILVTLNAKDKIKSIIMSLPLFEACFGIGDLTPLSICFQLSASTHKQRSEICGNIFALSALSQYIITFDLPIRAQAELYRRVGHFLLVNGHLSHVQAPLTKSFEILEQIHGRWHYLVAEALAELAEFQLNYGLGHTSEITLSGCFEFLEEGSISNPREIFLSIRVQVLMMKICLKLGRLLEAQHMIRTAIRHCVSVYGMDHPKTVFTRLSGVCMLFAVGDDKVAIKEAKECIDAVADVWGSETAAHALALMAMAKQEMVFGDIGRATKFALQAMGVFENLFGKDHPLVAAAAAISGLGTKRLGNAALSIPLLKRCVFSIVPDSNLPFHLTIGKQTAPTSEIKSSNLPIGWCGVHPSLTGLAYATLSSAAYLSAEYDLADETQACALEHLGLLFAPIFAALAQNSSQSYPDEIDLDKQLYKSTLMQRLFLVAKNPRLLYPFS